MRIVVLIFFLSVNLLKAGIISNTLYNVFSINDTLVVLGDDGYTVFPNKDDYNMCSSFSYADNNKYDTILEDIDNGKFVFTSNLNGILAAYWMNFDGSIAKKLIEPFVYSSVDRLQDVCTKGDTLFVAHFLYAGFNSYIDNNWYYIPIDTIPNNNVKIDLDADMFNPDTFYNKETKIVQNLSLGCAVINGQYYAQTVNGLYRSSDLEIWHQAVPVGLKAQFVKSFIESNNPEDSIIILKCDTNLGGHLSVDSIYQYENSLPGFYMSYDGLKSVVYEPSIFVGADVKISENFIYYLNGDTLIYKDKNKNNMEWNHLYLNMITESINSIQINDSILYIATEDKGLAIGKIGNDYYDYVMINKKIGNDLSEFYAYPTVINSSVNKTTFAYSLSKSDYVTIEIFDYNGDLVKTIIKDEYRNAASDNYNKKSTNMKRDIWNGYDRFNKLASPGTYFYKISAKKLNKSVYGKVILLKGK